MTREIGTVMLIDDDAVDQTSYQRVIKRSGLVRETLSFTYADEALEFLTSHPDRSIDVVLLDVNMPRMNGLEFLAAATRQLGTAFATDVYIMLTMPLGPEDEAQASSYANLRGFLPKPLTVAHLEGFAAAQKETPAAGAGGL